MAVDMDLKNVSKTTEPVVHTYGDVRFVSVLGVLCVRRSFEIPAVISKYLILYFM